MQSHENMVFMEIKNSMNSFEKEYNGYSEACYPGGIKNPVQAKEVKQAFYSGALTVLANIHEIVDGCTEEQAANRLQDLQDEIMAELRPNV